MSNPGSIFFGFSVDALERCRELGAGLPDRHYDPAPISIHLDYTGVEDCNYLIPTVVQNTVCTLVANVSGLVDLPPSMRGFNVSRTNEAIVDAIVNHSKDPQELNELHIVEDSAVQLVMIHEYAHKSRVKFRIENYPYVGDTPSGIATHEMVEVHLMAEATKEDHLARVTRRGVGIRLGGALACPLSQAMTRFKYRDMLRDSGLSSDLADRIADQTPLGTHMEHSYSSIFIETSDANWVDFRDLVRIASNALGQPFREILKKHDELSVILDMLGQGGPRFAEDVARSIILSLIKHLNSYSSDTSVLVSQDSLFTFSSFRIHVEKAGTIEDLRKSVTTKEH